MVASALNISQVGKRRLATAAVFAALAVAAWLATLAQMDGAGMGSRFTAGSFGFFVVLWVAMMAAMMFPSVWPAIAVYGLVLGRRASSGAPTVARRAAFVSGYLASWTGFGLLAFGLLALLRSTSLDTLSDVTLSRYVVAPVALAGALYQVVPFKQACLRHCRGPLSFFMTHWREGTRGAFRMGASHSVYCVGCCWMLMVVLLALGLMSVTWMAVVSGAIAVEKLAPTAWRRAPSALVAGGLVLLAIVGIVKPTWLPGVGGMNEMSKTK